MRTHDYWGKIAVKGNTITLDADEEKAKGGDGIGSALTFLEWDGSPLRLTVERTKVWRLEPWADFWFVARESVDADPWPMRYLRMTERVYGMGEIGGGRPKDQRILLTSARWSSMEDGHQVKYHVSWRFGALHVDGGWPTISLTAPVCELGLYGEACELRIAVE